MCGSCKKGYSETLSSQGVCAKCNNNDNVWLVPFAIVFYFGFVFCFYYMGKKEQSIPHVECIFV